ncbi:MAG: hypothetical protein JRE23_08790 [Deltaproteobacteria bacterium]|nr:hypothetical protein [Deltaproteobacteria bacterium]
MHKKLLVMLIILLIAKHVMFDAMTEDRGGKLLHAGLHGVSTQMILLVCAPVLSIPVILTLAAFDFGVHYAVDKVKLIAFREKYKRNGTVTRVEYWTLTILDQALHAMTYAIIMLVVIRSIRREVI